MDKKPKGNPEVAAPLNKLREYIKEKLTIRIYAKTHPDGTVTFHWKAV